MIQYALQILNIHCDLYTGKCKVYKR